MAELIHHWIEAHNRSRFDSVAKVMMAAGVPRTSSLSTPIQRIEDHKGEVLSCEFHPDGEILMSCGYDKQIHVCGVYGECESIMVMCGHKGAVMEAHFSADGERIYSCSADETIGIWDIATGLRMKQLSGHVDGINSINSPRRQLPILCSGSNDSTVRIWDIRGNLPTLTLDTGFQVTATCFTQTGEHVIYGGADNEIKIWDIRINNIICVLRGHSSTVSGMSLSPCGNYLLSHSIDNTLRIWDIRPSVTGDRCEKTFVSNQHFVDGNLLRCAWSPDGTMISAGSSDRYVSILDSLSGQIVSELAGHDYGIIDIDFHPREPIVMSTSSDEYVFLHEIED